jgi:hypothetical protein
MLLTVNVLGQKFDVFVVDVIEIDVVELLQLGQNKNKHFRLSAHSFKYFLMTCFNQYRLM